MTFQVGETPRLSVVVTNQAGAEADPAAIKININKPDGTVVVSDGSLEKSATGNYYYDYTLPVGVYGTYRYNITATGAEDRITIVKDSFLVEVAF